MPTSSLVDELGVANKTGVSVMVSLTVLFLLGLLAPMTGIVEEERQVTDFIKIILLPWFLSWLYYLRGSFLETRSATQVLEAKLKTIAEQLVGQEPGDAPADGAGTNMALRGEL